MLRLASAISLAATLLALPLAAQSVPDGASMYLDPPADSDPVARLSARLAYNSEGGAVAGLGFETDRLFGRDQTLRFSVEAQENAARVSLYYENEAIFGTSPTFGLRLLRSDSRAGDVYDFDATITRIEPRLTWRLSDTATVATYAYYAMNEIDNVRPGTSVLILADEGDQETAALGADLNYRLPVERGAAMRNAMFTFGAEIGSTSRDHEFLRLTARAQSVHVVGNGNVVLRSQVRFGALQTLSGTSSIGDRFMLGQASVRGFEFGGFGPRDLEVPGMPALGGNYYGLGRFDMQFPNTFSGNAERLTPGLFVDVGSLWGLDDVAGGAGGLDTVDDASHLRATIGLSLRIDTGIGPIQMYIAHPVAQQDYDLTQTFGLSLSHSF